MAIWVEKEFIKTDLCQLTEAESKQFTWTVKLKI